MHTLVPVTDAKPKEAGLPKEVPVKVLMSPFTLCVPSAFTKTTVAPGSMLSAAGEKVFEAVAVTTTPSALQALLKVQEPSSSVAAGL